MLSSILHLIWGITLRSWEDYFPPELYHTYDEECYNFTGNEPDVLKSNNSSVYVSYSSFYDITNSSAIRYEAHDKSRMLIEETAFNNYTSTSYGGSIFFGYEGECVLAFVCGVKCHTSPQN